MNISIMLTAISLTLGLIGTFTKTSEEKNGKKKPTSWGYILAALLMLSAGIAVFSQVQKQADDKVNADKQYADAKQQKLLSLIAVSSNFELAEQPQLDFVFDNVSNDKGEDVDANYDKFPGFGINDVSYSLDINLSEVKQATISGTELKPDNGQPELIDSAELAQQKTKIDSEDNEPEFNITAIKEPINNELNYLWQFPNYKSVMEVLFDFQTGREIGTLAFKKTKGELTDADLAKISTYINKKGSWNVTFYVKSDKLNNGLVYMTIPIKLSAPTKTDKGYEFTLITGEPKLSNFQNSPV